MKLKDDLGRELEGIDNGKVLIAGTCGLTKAKLIEAYSTLKCSPDKDEVVLEIGPEQMSDLLGQIEFVGEEKDEQISEINFTYYKGMSIQLNNNLPTDEWNNMECRVCRMYQKDTDNEVLIQCIEF